MICVCNTASGKHNRMHSGTSTWPDILQTAKIAYDKMKKAGKHALTRGRGKTVASFALLFLSFLLIRFKLKESGIARLLLDSKKWISERNQQEEKGKEERSQKHKNR